MADAPNVTYKDIEAYVALEAERLEHQRKAEDLKKQAEPYKAKLLEFVRAKGGKALSITRSRFLLAIKLVAGSVSWKPEFIKVAGQEAADEISKNCPKRESLCVERLS